MKYYLGLLLSFVMGSMSVMAETYYIQMSPDDPPIKDNPDYGERMSAQHITCVIDLDNLTISSDTGLIDYVEVFTAYSGDEVVVIANDYITFATALRDCNTGTYLLSFATPSKTYYGIISLTKTYDN